MLCNKNGFEMKKLLMLFFVLVLVSACASGSKTVVEEEYDVIETQEEADAMNSNTNKVVEEIQVPDRVYFALNKYNITNDSAEILKLQSEWLKADPSINIIVEGHCDERGTREYNLALGERRANAVKNFLVKQGVSASRIKTISYGKERPVVLGSGEAIWAKNRTSITVIAQ